MGLSDVFLLFRDSFYCDLSGSVEARIFLFNNVIMYYKQGIIFAASGFRYCNRGSAFTSHIIKYD